MPKAPETSQNGEVNEELVVEGEQEEPEALVTYEIASYPSDLTLWGIKDMWKQGDILIPEFQRNYVWTITQASLLIESFLLGLPVPQVFFYIDDENKNLVIDGQQRIVSLVYYFDGYFGDETQGRRQVFRLTGLDERSPFAGKRYEDLDEALQRRLRSQVLRAINIRQLSPKKENTSIYHIFERLNTGGTPLKPQEIRNCVFRGRLVTVLRELNADANWRRILGKKTLDKHQKDVELVLRIFALSTNEWVNYVKPMKEFLNVAMDSHKQGESKRVKQFEENFPKAAALIVDKLGSKPFHIRGPLNSSALDAVISTVIDHLAHVPNDLGERYKKLLQDKDFVDATYYGTSDVTVLHTRFTRAKKKLID